MVQINVNGLYSPVRQQHLLNFFLHSSFDALSLNDTRLTSSSAKFIFKTEQSHYNFRSYWTCSSSSCPHNGVGDFNIDEIAHSSYPSRHFKLLRLLISHYFTDYQAHSSPLTGSDCTYFYNNGSSLTPCPDLLDRPFTDHRVLITIFDFNSCFAILVKSRFKQKKEGQSVFTYTSTTDKQWEKFSSKANTGFQLDAAISGPYVDHDFL
ncbi:hypothetical protein RhiirA4_468817 [Rhizophagus irregularis]|uniref:Uncharacterized protein n=1 Tax=Rhizophagus irregularis TaxID=588596 RepID=A0A2I1GYF0_9GLOM|nr:hypothetical protein RhiirA4_468817 [Rhizophagus irregularis]